MRFSGIACAGMCLLGLAVFGRQGLTTSSPFELEISAPDLSGPSVPIVTTESLEMPEGPATGEGGGRGSTVTRPSVASGGSTSQSSRRRGRYRYEEPLPSPADWLPPEGPVRIALQAGHWRANEAPRELSGLRDNGTAWQGTAEWEVNLAIARRAGAMLEEIGYEVDILPAVVPPAYRAHLFIAIHADGADDPAANGFRVAAPRRDATGRASQVVALLQESYGAATGLRNLPVATRRMENYYAFNSRRYEHALHPMTIGVIIETGFLTSASDRQVIVNDPERSARGIVEAVLAFPETPPPGVRTGIPPG